VQVAALQYLLLKPRARFSELNLKKLTTDHFNFHIKRLVDQKLIAKDVDGKYMLTVEGKELANRLDLPKRILSKEHKIVAIIGCTREKANSKEYLFQKRLKHPFYGMHDFVSGRVGWGEDLFSSTEKILKRETNLTASLILVGMEHKKDFSEDGSIIEDKYMFIFRGNAPKGTLRKKFKGGENFWISQSKIKKLDNLFPNIPMFIDMINKKDFTFTENSYTNPLY